MPKWLKILIAAVACAIVLIGFSVMSVALGFKHGGGYLIMALLFSFLGGIWRAIVGSDKTEKVETQENNSTETIDSNVSEVEMPMTETPAPAPIDSSPEPVSVMKNEDITVDKAQEVTMPDFHIVLKALLIAMMVVGIIVMIYQAVNDFTWENYTLGWVRLVSSIIGLGGFALLYMKKLSGFIIIACVLLFCIVYSAIMHDTGLGLVVGAAVFRLVTLSLILLIRKDGISAWAILLNRHMSTVQELKETFPIKPFMYVEKMPEPLQKDPAASRNNFRNWLNK